MNPDFLRRYLEFYQDLGIKTLYRKRGQPDPSEFCEAAAEAEPCGSPEENSAVQAVPILAETAAAPEPGGSPEENSAVQAVPILERIRAEIGEDCRRCKLHEQRSKVVFGSGDPEAKLVFVGEGPGADEDAQGLPFVGRAGQLLTQMIDNTARKEGIPIERKDVYICNVVKCRPPQNRTPEPDEMEICGQFLFRQLEAIRPKAICVLGATAAKALLNRKEGVTRMRGNWYEWHGIQVMVTYHPSYLLRPYNQDAKREAWEDLKKTLHYVYD